MKRIISLLTLITMVFVLAAGLMSCQPKQEQQSPKPKTAEQVFGIVYDWLLKEGELKNGTELVYTYKSSDTDVNINYKSSSENLIMFTMSFPDYNGNKLTLRYSIPYNEADRNHQTYTVRLESKKNRAFAWNVYSYSPSEFVKNSPVKANVPYTNQGTFVSTTARPYTEEEIQDGLALCKTLNEIHHRSHIVFLNWLRDSFCPDVGVTMADLGYLKYE